MSEALPFTLNRPALAELRCPLPHDITGIGDRKNPQWREPEYMIPELVAAFEDTDTLRSIIDVLGQVTKGNTKTYADDGLAQQVTVKAGIEARGTLDLPSPIRLVPFASYPECAQSPQDYVLRARGGGPDDVPEFKLYRVEDRLFEQDRQLGIVAWLKAEFLSKGVEYPVF